MVTNQELKALRPRPKFNKTAARNSRKNWLRKRGLRRDPAELTPGFVRGASAPSLPRRYRTVSQGKGQDPWQHERPATKTDGKP